MKNIEYFFKPQSIAIIGASPNVKALNGMLLKYLLRHNYGGQIYPVNPKYQEISGLKCYPRLADIPGPVDMVLVAIAAKNILPTLEQCAAKGVKSAVVYSSGFAETGEAGRETQEEINTYCQEKGIALCGPNCLGTVNLLENTVVASSPVLEDELVKGSVGFVSQSGAFGFVTFHQAQDEHVGFTYLVTTGNEAVLGTADLIEYMVEDDATKAVICYMEGLKDGDKFKGVAKKALAGGIPLVVFKVGKTEAGIKAIASHTAALAGSDNIFDAFFRQKGIVRATDSDALIDFAKIFANGRRAKGRGAAILSTSGGAGIMSVDTFLEYGMEIPDLTEESTQAISKIIPSYGSALNPVDVTAQIFGEPAYMQQCLQVLVDDPNVDYLLVSLSTVGGETAERIAEGLISVYNNTEKPIAVSWGASERLVGTAYARLGEAGIPLYKQPIRCARALAALANYSMLEQDFANNPDFTEMLPSGEEKAVWRDLLKNFPGETLTEDQSKKLLDQAGIPVTREILVDEEEKAVAAAAEIGYPVVLKVMSPKILHKTEAGVLAIGIENEVQLRQSYREIYAKALIKVTAADISGVLVQEMAPKGIEAVIGVKNDPQFGPTIMFGLGGILVEVLKDVTFKIAPLSRADARSMLQEIKGKKMLAGFRGQPAIHEETLVDTILQVSQLAYALKDEVAEMDINPIVLYPDGLKVVDALIIKK